MKKRNRGMSLPMFSSIHLKNFKAYKDTGEVPLAPLTIIVGANNSGKSTLMQAILVLAQTIKEASSNRALVTSGPLVQLNGFYDILHRNEISQESFEIALTLNPQTVEHVGEFYWGPIDDAIVGERLEVSFFLDSSRKEIGVKRAAFLTADNESLLEIDAAGIGRSDLFELRETDRILFQLENFLPDIGWERPRNKERESLLRRFGINSGVAQRTWRHALLRVFRTGPLRVRVPWWSGVGATSSSEIGLGGENLIAELGSREPISRDGQTLVDAVNGWLSGKLGMPDRVRVKDIDKTGSVRSLFCDERRGAKKINVAAMGEGVSQVLPIVSRSFIGSEAECLFVEQPEIHLHPALQADLADLFIDVVQRNTRQIVVETHSEHLMLRLRRRVAEGAIEPSRVAIIYVERKGSESKVRRLEMSNKGEFDDWPEGFFDEGYKEAMALAMAASKKG